jgi:hypothetical protein
MCHDACLLCHAVKGPNFTFLELLSTIGYPSSWFPMQERKEESSWSECPVTLDPSYFNNCPNDIVGIEAVAMADKKCGLNFCGWGQTKLLLKCPFVTSSFWLHSVAIRLHRQCNKEWDLVVTFGRHFIELYRSFLCSQLSAAGANPEPDESGPLPSSSLKLPFNVIFRSTPGLLWNSFFSLGFLTELQWL